MDCNEPSSELTMWSPNMITLLGHNKLVHLCMKRPGGRLYIKMLSYQYRGSHVKDKTVSLTVLSLKWGSPYLGKTVFILRQGPGLVIWLASGP